MNVMRCADVVCGKAKRPALNPTNSNPDYLKVNGKPYVVGDTAYTKAGGRRSRGSRYTRDYYGVLLASTMFRMFEDEEPRELVVSASHPAGDIRFVPELAKAVRGSWKIESCGQARTYTVGTVYTYPEPLGGFINAAVSEDETTGQLTVDEDLASSRVLVLDIGGLTTNTVVIEKGCRINFDQTGSIEIGALEAYERFRGMFMDRYKDVFPRANLDPPRSRASPPNRRQQLTLSLPGILYPARGKHRTSPSLKG